MLSLFKFRNRNVGLCSFNHVAKKSVSLPSVHYSLTKSISKSFRRSNNQLVIQSGNQPLTNPFSSWISYFWIYYSVNKTYNQSVNFRKINSIDSSISMPVTARIWAIFITFLICNVCFVYFKKYFLSNRWSFHMWYSKFVITNTIFAAPHQPKFYIDLKSFYSRNLSLFFL